MPWNLMIPSNRQQIPHASRLTVQGTREGRSGESQKAWCLYRSRREWTGRDYRQRGGSLAARHVGDDRWSLAHDLKSVFSSGCLTYRHAICIPLHIQKYYTSDNRTWGSSTNYLWVTVYTKQPGRIDLFDDYRYFSYICKSQPPNLWKSWVSIER